MKEVAFRSVPLTLEARTSAGFSEAELTKRLEGRPETVRAVPRGAGIELEDIACDAGKPIDLPVLDFGDAGDRLASGRELRRVPACRAEGAAGVDFVLVAGYGECGPGYIPIERAWKEHDGNLNDWSWVNPGSEKRMMAAIDKALK